MSEKHPLLIDTIVTKILNYSNLKNLKNNRLVCRKWDSTALSKMKRKYKLSINSERVEEIQNGRFANYLFHFISVDSGFFNGEEEFAFAGPHLKKIEFKLLQVNELHTLEYLQSFIELCPNLVEIDLVIKITEPIENTDWFYSLSPTSLSKVRSLSVNCDEVNAWLVELIEVCGRIRTLKLQLEESQISNMFQKLSQIPDCIQHLRTLEFDGCCLLSVTTMHYFLSVPWKISSLKIFVENIVPASLMRLCLSNLSETLTELKLYWLCWNENMWGGSRESLIPLDIRKLETLDINTSDNCTSAFFYSESLSLVPSFVTAVQLPQLKSLRINGNSTLGLWKQYTQQMDGFDTYMCKSLQKLTIIGYRDYTCFLPTIHPFTNLKELNILISFPCPELIASVLKNFNQLERLSLSFHSCSDFQWEIILLGSEETDIVSRRVSLKTESPLIGSIRNLKQLKTLNLSGCRLTDKFIYNGLIHLLNLRYLMIPDIDAKFSRRAIKSLIEHLGPNVNLNFKNKTEELRHYIYGI